MKELAERIEGGETGREIDAEVAELDGYYRHTFFASNSNGSTVICKIWRADRYADSLQDEIDHWKDLIAANLDHPDEYEGLPHYSTSLDAVAALVERVLPGWGWRIDSTATIPELKLAGITGVRAIASVIFSPTGQHAVVAAHTHTAALLAALLRAKAIPPSPNVIP